MSADPHHQFRVRIDQLTDELNKAQEQVTQQRRRADRWYDRAYTLTRQVALLRLRLQQRR